MRRLFYPRLAAQNLRRNRRFYFPYLLTGILTVAMFYNILFLTVNPDMGQMPSAENLKFIMVLGCVVVGLFSVIFGLYTNSFLMKRRQKELGLYNVLGMEKRHIAKVLLFENLFSFLIMTAGGILAGILLSKLLLLALCQLLFFEVQFGFQVSLTAIGITAALFAAVSVLALLGNLLRVGRAKPVELLRGGNEGEREPKTKWILAILGVLTLGTGYYLAMSVDNPVDAILLFFVAVLLVIVGTYCLFTAGSIAVLKLMKKNKAYYYRTKHFVSLSGMLYRMKQNAVGLANICILCTMVLVMISTTVCLYIGVDDALVQRFPRDISFSLYSGTPDAARTERLSEVLTEQADAAGLTIENRARYTLLGLPVVKDGNVLRSFNGSFADELNATHVGVMTATDYGAFCGEEILLQPTEIWVYSPGAEQTQELELLGERYTVVRWLDEFLGNDEYASYLGNGYYVIVRDEQTLYGLQELCRQNEGCEDVNACWYDTFDLSGSDEQIQACYRNMVQASEQPLGDGTYYTLGECRQETRTGFYVMYGGLLFLGLFLGVLFLMATVLIIYYKQISEGYEDKARFEIMQQVGMSEAEVKASIRSQILTVFFLPLLAAGIHLAFAFKMICKMLAALNLIDVTLFAWTVCATVVVFGLVYLLIYALTAKTYYKIVR